jgi:hypothetical protein
MEATEKIKNAKKGFALPKEMLQTFVGSRYVQPYSIFYLLNKEFPNKINFTNTDKDKLLELLLKEFKLDTKDIIISKTFNFDSSSYSLNSVVIPIKKNVFVFFNPGVESEQAIELLFCASSQLTLVNRIEEIIKSCYSQTSTVGKIFLLKVQDYGGFDITPFSVTKCDVDIHKHYNDDFTEVNNIITKRLNTENDKGLVLLHGKPGTGKTSYIRYLTTQVKKRMIFLSLEMAHKISSPEFISILSSYPNSIIIIEDAETVIEERKGGGDSAISNLLNLTDGLLADCLKIQLICTFNTDVSKIDKALLRKGRLIARYDFKDLELNKAQALSNELGFKIILEKDTSVSEIFNQEEKTFTPETESKIGFNFKEIKVA